MKLRIYLAKYTKFRNFSLGFTIAKIIIFQNIVYIFITFAKNKVCRFQLS